MEGARIRFSVSPSGNPLEIRCPLFRFAAGNPLEDFHATPKGMIINDKQPQS
jgi:hypothetical protein